MEKVLFSFCVSLPLPSAFPPSICAFLYKVYNAMFVYFFKIEILYYIVVGLVCLLYVNYHFPSLMFNLWHVIKLNITAREIIAVNLFSFEA